MSLDPNLITAGDLEDFEEYAGVAAGDVIEQLQSGSLKGLTAKAITGVLWWAAKQADPSFTLEQARGIKFGEVELAARPTKAGKAT